VNRLILVTGGARSGKSAFAQQLAHRLGGDVSFVATAELSGSAHSVDEEMIRRIAAHRQSRPAAWRTIEAPRRVGQAISAADSAQVFLVDCLTLLVCNVLLSLGDEPTEDAAQTAVDDEVRELIEAIRTTPSTVIIVTNEVGLGIVPVNRLARLYRDLLGRANATLARESAEVYLLVAGLPLEIKALAVQGEVE
jgi:adenosylcobinamide kinase / adenosylcobinamide-phosphate guanylyltransferase